jgi:hypothetical protein
MNKKLSITFLSALIALNIVGCGDKSGTSQSEGLSRTSTSLKPQSQLDFENSIKQINAKMSSAGASGTRGYEEASQGLKNFWDDKMKNMSRVDDWVCIYTSPFKWEPERNIKNPSARIGMGDGPIEDNEYQIRCADADKPFKAEEMSRDNEIQIRIKVSKASNITPIYSGDVISFSGPLDKFKDLLGVEVYSVGPREPLYIMTVNADSLKIIKKGS